MQKSPDGKQALEFLLAQKNVESLEPPAKEIYEKYTVSPAKNHDVVISSYGFPYRRPSVGKYSVSEFHSTEA